MTVHHDAAVGFGRAAAVYERSRPGYPDATIDWLRDRTAMASGRLVIDLAAGTGKLTRRLRDTGATVVAVEPVAAMLRMLSKVTDGRVAAVAGTAHALPLATGCADVVTVGQGFHWFADEPALAEMTRVLRPHGTLALLWNRRPSDDPLQGALEDIVGPLRGDTPSVASGQWRSAIDRSRVVIATASHVADHEIAIDIDRLVERVVSTSFVAALPERERADIERRVRALGAAFGATPTLRYRCETYLFTRR